MPSTVAAIHSHVLANEPENSVKSQMMSEGDLRRLIFGWIGEQVAAVVKWFIWTQTHTCSLTQAHLILLFLSQSLILTLSHVYKHCYFRICSSWCPNMLSTPLIWQRGRRQRSNLRYWCFWLRPAVKSSCGHQWTLKIPSAYATQPNSFTPKSLCFNNIVPSCKLAHKH